MDRDILKKKKKRNLKMFIKTLFSKIIMNDVHHINERNNIINKNLNIEIDTLSTPINKNTLPACNCLTCNKIFVGYRYKQRMIQHCNNLNHTYY